MADENNDNGNEQEQKGGGSTMKIVIIAVFASMLLSGGVAGGVMFALGVFDKAPEATAEAEAVVEPVEEEKGPPQYHSMDPKFVISFRDQKNARFMQFSLQLMTRDNDVMKQIESHMPAIRSNLLLLFGQQKYADMVTRSGKEKLLVDVKADVNQTLAVLNDSEVKDSIESAYFNSFVIQ